MKKKSKLHTSILMLNQFHKVSIVTIVIKLQSQLWLKIDRVEKLLQLNECETVRYFLQLSQKLTSDCLLTLVYLPVFASFCKN